MSATRICPCRGGAAVPAPESSVRFSRQLVRQFFRLAAALAAALDAAPRASLRALRCAALCAALCALCLGLFAAAPAWAHPHVFVDNSVTFVFDGPDLAGVRVHWVFDDMFGTMIKEDFDTDGDGTFSKAEVEGVRVGAFDNLKNFDYFTFIEVDGKPFKVATVSDFKTGFEAEDGRLFYDFFVPCRVQGGAAERTVLLSEHDPEYYADLYTPEDAEPGLENAGGVQAEATVYLNSEKLYSPFQAWTPEVTLKFTKR